MVPQVLATRILVSLSFRVREVKHYLYVGLGTRGLQFHFV